MAKDTNAKKTRGRPPKYEGELVGLHFVVPVKIRSYLEAAAYRKSTPHHTVSLTEYFCNLVYQDMLMEENENDRLHKKKLSFYESRRM